MLASSGDLWMRYYSVLGTKSAYINILEPGFDAILTYANDGAGRWDMDGHTNAREQNPRIGLGGKAARPK
jgi:hypothetical protein